MLKELIKKFIPQFLLNFYHWCWALGTAIFYWFPSQKMIVIGITGTQGKSTVVYLAGKILEEAGYKVGWISSLTLKVGEKEWLNPYHMTMPGRGFIQKMLRQMAMAGCRYALLEVTSEGIKQYRHSFINFSGAVFTNLAPEHIQAHGSYEKYRAIKGKLFKAVAKRKDSFGVYNLDDKEAGYFLKFPVAKKYGCSIKSQIPSPTGLVTKFQIQNLKLTPDGSEFVIDGQKFDLKLLGEFNAYNAAAAIMAGLSQNVSLETAQRALEKVKSIPGRLEMIDEGQDFMVVVDLAHTPDSFEKVFQLFKNLLHRKIISVFGSAGGGRDKWKRPKLGEIASKYSDRIIICNEDPYYENPKEIIDEIAAGCQNENFEMILDRRKAIARGLSLAEKGDLVLVLGKGTEQTYVIGSKKYPWDDRRVVKEELGKLKGRKREDKGREGKIREERG